MSAVLSSPQDLSAVELAAVNGFRQGIALPFSFKGPTCQGACHLVIVRQQDETVVLMSDRYRGAQASLLHSFAKVATIVHQQFLHDVERQSIRWLEHCPAPPGYVDGERIERVRLLWSGETHRYTHALRQLVHSPYEASHG